jgi:ATP-dependent exoDNAse (exonuclease V) beta subunit
MDSELSDEDQGNRVQVMTAHAAKGLEFNITIVAAMDKGTRRESGPVTFTPEHGLGVKWRNPALDDGKEGMKDSWAEANKAVASRREADEENRLLYVAMTRAAEHLILSYSCGKSRPSNWAKLVEACFNLHPPAPSPEARREDRDGYSASILVTSSDPPPIAQKRTDSADADAEIVPPPIIEDQHEAALTVTSLAVFGSCPRRYYIQRSLGWNSGRFRRFDPDAVAADSDPDDGEDLAASDIGTAVHDLLAGLHPSHDSEEARRLAEVFFRSDLGLRAAAAPRAAREWAFIADIDSALVRGTVDLWFEENHELHLIDYKTDAVTTAAAPERAREYVPQLAFYAMALERALGIRPKVAWLHFLQPNTVVEIALDDATISAARSLIATLRDAQNELRFDLNEGEHCRTCPFYRSLCPAGRDLPEGPEESGILNTVEPDDYSAGN